MKKLLVAAMGIAAAYGAFADPYINAVRLTESGEKDIAGLEAAATITTMQGTHFGAPLDSAGTNQYAITAITGDLPTVRPLSGLGETFQDDPTTELSVKTQFGKPLEFYVDPANTAGGMSIGDGLYFDSMVKFTVCDGDPDQEYPDAKIVMWLQEATNSVGDVVGTNIVVKAGYLSKDGTVSAVARDYTCGNTIGGDFADKWHRVTIKAIADITADEETGVPAFAIYIDGGDTEAIKEVASTNPKWDSSFNNTLTEAADYLNKNGFLFPSMKQGTAAGNTKLSCVAFDGTGFLNDLVVTDQLPGEFAKDHEANKATVVIDGDSKPFESIAEAIEEINADKHSGATASLSLMKSMTLTEPITFTGNGATTITLDFAGFVLTNELEVAAITNSAATLIITNSVGNGGIYCTDWENDASAIYNSNGKNIAIQDGVFYGIIDYENSEVPGIVVSGGAFTDGSVVDLLADDKTLNDPEQEGGLYVVVDKPAVVYYTVTVGTPTHASVVVATNGVTIGTAGGVYENCIEAGSDVTVVYTADTGYELTGTAEYSFPAIAAAPQPTTAPTATAISYAITYTLKTATGAAPVAGSYTVETASPVALTQPAAVTGYTFSGWYDNAELTGDPVTSFTVDTAAPAAKVFYGQFTATTYTITYKNADGTAFTAWADQYVAPDSFTVESDATLPVAANVALLGGTFNGWTNAVGTAVTTTEGLTADLVVFANVTAGSTNWATNPEAIADNTPASEVYSELTGSALESTDAKKLTVWAKEVGHTTVGAVAEAVAGDDLYDAYLLNCATSEEALETAKENFKIPSITFDKDGKPVIAEPSGTYNGSIQQKGSNDLSTWTTIDDDTHKAENYQFFKLELVP